VEENPPRLETHTVETTADSGGRWIATFEPARASFQSTWIIATSGGTTLAARNVLIGEVWVCAGQSNMAWSNFNRKAREAASADFPGLRYVAWHDSWYQPFVSAWRLDTLPSVSRARLIRPDNVAPSRKASVIALPSASRVVSAMCAQ